MTCCFVIFDTRKVGICEESEKGSSYKVGNCGIKYVDGDKAAARGYVIGKAEGKTGFKVLVYCHYDIEYVRTPQGWKMSLFDEGATVPIGDEVSELHSQA